MTGDQSTGKYGAFLSHFATRNSLARSIRAASFSRPVVGPDFRELVAVALETNNGSMEYRSLWALDPDSAAHAEVASMKQKKESVG